MDLYGQKSKSIPQKLVIHLIEIILLWISYWILFQNGGAWVENNIGINNAEGNVDRRSIIFIFNLIILFSTCLHDDFYSKKKNALGRKCKCAFLKPTFVLPFIFVSPFEY